MAVHTWQRVAALRPAVADPRKLCSDLDADIPLHVRQHLAKGERCFIFRPLTKPLAACPADPRKLRSDLDADIPLHVRQ